MIERDGANLQSIVDVVGYAHTKLMRHLRGRSLRIDLVEIDDGRPLPPGAISVTVYRQDS